jgi:microcystin-dependent protein
MTPYIGEIRMFAGTFAPVGWEFCDGQLMPISENEALFQLIGTTYGGDGEETFALPNLQSRVPVHMGTSPVSGITRQIGDADGVESVTLTINQIPIHNHPMLANSQTVTTELPTNAVLASSPAVDSFATPLGLTSMPSDVISFAGGSQPHDNMMPFLTISFIISMFGVFPSQT